MKKVIGATLISSPFVGMFSVLTMQKGLTEAVVTFGAAIAVVVVIVAGVFLLSSD